MIFLDMKVHKMPDPTDGNEMNEANFEEVQAHCQLLNAKLMQINQKNPAACQVLEDLVDQFERGISLRQMHIQTLQEVIREHDASDAAFRALVQKVAVTLLALSMVLLAVYDYTLFSYLVTTFGSYALVAVVSALAVRYYK